ncbi:hypothetical protein B0T20DRAFT_110051 [Sordaria brevicollis]|uniref:Transmembrane protein n=1 Tax=Sordaria brevicollis TaxID=83679 RepID=A0AAE0U257_SORBR|nr:hypothetical protein B0T20DRAFT_110051 [Sordaria brevicollis]
MMNDTRESVERFFGARSHNIQQTKHHTQSHQQCAAHFPTNHRATTQSHNSHLPKPAPKRPRSPTTTLHFPSPQSGFNQSQPQLLKSRIATQRLVWIAQGLVFPLTAPVLTCSSSSSFTKMPCSVARSTQLRCKSRVVGRSGRSGSVSTAGLNSPPETPHELRSLRALCTSPKAFCALILRTVIRPAFSLSLLLLLLLFSFQVPLSPQRSRVQSSDRLLGVRPRVRFPLAFSLVVASSQGSLLGSIRFRLCRCRCRCVRKAAD